MPYDSKIHHRQSIRAKGYDYSEPGGYFVTVCTKNKKCILSDIVEGKSKLSSYGDIIQMVWKDLPKCFPSISLDEWVVMPNHFHGVLIAEAQFIAPNNEKGAINRAPTLGDGVRAFKALTTYRVRKDLDSNFGWQRNYYDHIIRDDADLNRIRQYILDNPAQWELDEENPNRNENRKIHIFSA